MDRKKIVVIGAGPGGYVAALRAAALGGEVTVIEKEHLGGTCLNWGCIPSKIMKTSADLYLKFKEANEFGIKVEGTVTADMTAIMARKQKIVEMQRKGILSLLQHAKVKFEQGRGYIKGKGVVAIINEAVNNKSEDGNTQNCGKNFYINSCKHKEIYYDSLIIATGTSPLNIGAFPFDGESILSSNHLLSLNEIPKSIVIVGGGVIGCEFASILSALGSNVTVVEAMSRLLPLPSVDESCSATLQREMKKRKIKIITDKVVEKAEKRDGKLILTLGISPFSDKASKVVTGSTQPQIANQQPQTFELQTLETEKMAVCIGRSPLASNLGLENIDLKTNEKGWIDVNDYMETSISGVYAIGDILGPQRIMLAHVASHEGMVAAQNAMNLIIDSNSMEIKSDDVKQSGTNGKVKMNYRAVPSAIFTMPEIGNVGLTESQAKTQGIDVKCSTVNFRVLGKAHAIGEIAGEAKIVAEASTDKVLGVHITGPHATDLIAEATLAVNKGLTVSDIAHTIHAHPTLSEIMSEVAFKVSGNGLHG
ncbi:MAG: dihydrolipoyl dehydrogenase [Desulfamplus sp.]|nr:dihydrolipoyl dehydrogenase [Desulfamplus sp.]